MQKRHVLMNVSIGLGVLIVILACASLFTYGVFVKHWNGPVTRFISRITSFPAAKVGSKSITYSEYLKHIDALKTFMGGPSAKALGIPTSSEKEMTKQALDRVIRIAVIEEIASAEKLDVTSTQIDDALKNVTDRMLGATSTEAEIESFSRDQFGWSVVDLKTFVIRPALMEDGLRQKYSNENKDFDTYLDKKLNGTDVKRYLQI